MGHKISPLLVLKGSSFLLLPWMTVVSCLDDEGHEQECNIARSAGAYLVFIDVGVQQLLVAAVDDSWAVTGSKDVGHAVAGEGLQADGLAAQAQLLSIT